jgi:hypothetical protein
MSTLRDRRIAVQHAAGNHADCLPTAECQQRPAWIRLREANRLPAKAWVR